MRLRSGLSRRTRRRERERARALRREKLRLQKKRAAKKEEGHPEEDPGEDHSRIQEWEDPGLGSYLRFVDGRIQLPSLEPPVLGYPDQMEGERNSSSRTHSENS